MKVKRKLKKHNWLSKTNYPKTKKTANVKKERKNKRKTKEERNYDEKN